jgi:serine/threonine-protein kinase
MPPEQFKGKASVESDIYALGATMFYLLTGQEPEPLSISHPAALNHEVPAALDRIVARATALDLESRYTSASSLHADLLSLPTSSMEVVEDHIIRYSKLEAELR